ncbi:DUF3099 domain-containing protein [Pseudoclavibacter sp. 13-3]|uniref:DUF3099 domain-containing protein n=1 Tax=Pseudoclavibacter sp. 13-3 TaxID=2901228 RepID=UPI001E648014|nr:DUF3099 domain-containing protein [Pseudoclavibacter sp. 13-3]MCD7101916.1 DUF3099 domain-containing protein [Pseudoclavibacter sp. 13-3]
MPNREVAVVTHAPNSPRDDRVRRMVHYSIAMGIRIVCVLALFVVPGWWKLVPAFGAAFLPYYAVVIANLPKRVNDDGFQSIVQQAISQKAHEHPADSGFPETITVDEGSFAHDGSPFEAGPGATGQQPDSSGTGASTTRSAPSGGSSAASQHDQLTLRHA